VGGVVGVVLFVVLAVWAVTALSRYAGGIELTEGPRAERSPTDDGEASPQPPEELAPLDLDDLEGVDAELGAILVDIDRSELQMIETQDLFAQLLADAATTPGDADPEGLLEGLSDIAGDGQRELQEIRSDLAGADASTSAVRDVRDTYLTHLDAWVRYFVAIEDDARLLVSGEDQAFTLAINSSADAFARQVREELPDGVDPRVRDYAEAILDRGFPGRDPSSGDTV
jgi:hypothetical protein